MTVSASARWIVAFGIAAASAVGIGLLQPKVARQVELVGRRDDVFTLPPPMQLRALTLGYRAAAADILWARLNLEFGLHWQEKRAFPDAPRYVDGILALEPDFPTVYKFVDTILVYGPTGGTDDDARKARQYLERGLRERPYDPAMWQQYGQFIAFSAPSFLKDEAEIERWRIEGAKALTRAVELGADAQRALAATSMLKRAGHDAETKEHLERAYALTDDADLREQILMRIASLKDEKLRTFEGRVDATHATNVVEREWRTKFSFLSRGQALLLGPYRSPTACAGPASEATRDCAKDWSAKIADER